MIAYSLEQLRAGVVIARRLIRQRHRLTTWMVKSRKAALSMSWVRS